MKKTEPEYYPPVENLLDLIYEHYTENNPVEKNTVAGKAANHGLSSPPARSFRATCTRNQGHRHGLKATSRFTRDITPR